MRPQELISLKADSRPSNNSDPFTLKCPQREFSSKSLFLTGASFFALNLWNHKSTLETQSKSGGRSLSILKKSVASTSSGFAHHGPRPPHRLLTPPQIASGFLEQADSAPKWGSACRQPWQPLPKAGPVPQDQGLALTIPSETLIHFYQVS